MGLTFNDKKMSIRAIILMVFVFLAPSSMAQEVQWMSLSEALAAQKVQPKKIFIDVYTVWCGPCKLYDRNTFSNAKVADFINENFYPVKFNGEGNEVIVYKGKTYSNPKYDPAKAKRRNAPHQFSGYLGINAYPTVVFMDESGNLIKRVRGYRTAQQLELFLKFFGTDLWRSILTQKAYDDYVANFKPSF